MQSQNIVEPLFKIFLFLIQDFGLKNLWCKISDLL